MRIRTIENQVSADVVIGQAFAPAGFPAGKSPKTGSAGGAGKSAIPLGQCCGIAFGRRKSLVSVNYIFVD